MPAVDPATLERFVTAVSRYRAAGVFNPWGERCELDALRQPAAARRRRLLAHLSAPTVRLVLVGEAIGYQGGRYTGIAFTSERLLLEGVIPHLDVEPPARLTSRALPWSEPSASIVWRTLQDTGLATHTILFNAYPWHPMGKAKTLSNRRPSEPERRDGLVLLERLLALYPNATIGAVGRSAERSVADLGRTCVPLRHPAYGGATRFAAGVAELC